MSGFTMYLLSIAEDVKGMLMVLSFITLIISICVGALRSYDEDFQSENPEIEKRFWKRCSIVLITACCVLFLSVLIPDVKTIVALHVANSVANSDTVSKDVPELTKLGIEVLKKNLEEKK